MLSNRSKKSQIENGRVPQIVIPNKTKQSSSPRTPRELLGTSIKMNCMIVDSVYTLMILYFLGGVAGLCLNKNLLLWVLCLGPLAFGYVGYLNFRDITIKFKPPVSLTKKIGSFFSGIVFWGFLVDVAIIHFYAIKSLVFV